MSHQTGITPTSELNETFSRAKELTGTQRVLQVKIEDEQLHLAEQCDVRGTWDEDFNAMVPPLLEDKVPCYIFYRTDTTDTEGYKWIFIVYIPDNSPVRQKMLYASTKATLKMSFGGTSHIDEEFTATLKNEVTLDGYNKHLQLKAAPGPLSFAEIESKMVQEMETRSDIGVETKSQTLPGLSFPVDAEALERLQEIRDHKHTYVRLRIDLDKEMILLESNEHTSVDQLPSRVPNDSPRYHIFVYPHSYEGDNLMSVVFIYTMPGYSCSVKERMLYSSCKAPLIHNMTEMGIEFAVKLEVGDGKELTEDFLLSEIHPIRIIHKPKFEKPKGPAGRRGQSRVTASRETAQ